MAHTDSLPSDLDLPTLTLQQRMEFMTNTDTNTFPDLLEDATNTILTGDLDFPILTLTPADLLLLKVEGEDDTSAPAPTPTEPPIIVNKYQDQLTRAGVMHRAGDLIASSWTSFNAQVSPGSITLEFKIIFLIYRPRTLTKTKKLRDILRS